MAKPELKAACIRLRVEQGLSQRQIVAQTGASQGSVSRWLQPYPLPEDEKGARIVQGARLGGLTGKKGTGAKSKYAEMAEGRTYSTLQRAKVAEAAVLYRLVIHGFNPFGSMFDGDKTDWLVEVPSGQVHRLQVKTARSGRHGRPAISLHCSDGVGGSRTYRKGEFDFMVAHDLFTDTCYVWSWPELEGQKRSITITPDAAEAWGKLMACSSVVRAFP